MEQLCLSVGYGGERQFFGDDLAALAGMICEYHFSLIEEFIWTDQGTLETHAFSGPEAIAVYWGDKDGEFIQCLTKEQQSEVEQYIRREQAETNMKPWS